MPYYNRRSQLITTLASMSKSKSIDQVEIIIVDDCSTERIDDIKDFFPNLNISLYRFEDKFWKIGIYGYNLAFSKATGDFIAITNPECLHVGDVLSSALKTASTDKYLVFSCYSIDKLYTNILRRGGSLDSIPYYDGAFDGIIERGWMQHTKHRTWDFNWFTVLSKESLGRLGGFDERYINGYSYGDTEFTDRIKMLDLRIERIDDPFVIHQSHGMPSLNYDNATYKTNQELYFNTKKEIYCPNSFIDGNDIKYTKLI